MRIDPADIRYVQLYDADLITRFVRETWSRYYPEAVGVTDWPQWFYEWQFLDSQLADNAHCLGAYLLDKLVGLACIDRWSILNNGTEQGVTLVSCFTLLPGRTVPYASRGMIDWIIEWSKQHDSHFFYGYINPSLNQQRGRGYWSSRPDTSIKIDDAPIVWQYRAREQNSVLPVPASAEEVSWALRALNERLQQSNSDTHFVWTSERLQRQMRWRDEVKSWSLSDERGTAICNSYVLPCHDKTFTAMTDFVLSDSHDATLEGDLLKQVAHSHMQQGAHRFYTLGPPVNASTVLRAAGFFPCIPSYSPMYGNWIVDFPQSAFPSRMSAVVYR